MSENKFLARLKGEPTPKSVVEIQNDRLVASFKSSPMGHIADRDSSVVVAKGAQNWAVNQGLLVPVADDYIGTESDLSGTSRVSGAGLWLNATYTFPATGDETNPVSAIIAPSAKWVLTLCGDSLMTQNGSVITLTMLVKIGATHLTTKQFKVRECASQFSQRMAIDFSESEQSVIKAHGGSPLTVQVLCDDESASATIYSGMTHLTLLQRKIDADLVATDNVLLPEFIENLLKGYIIPADYFSNYEYLDQIQDGGKAIPEFTRTGDKVDFTGWAKPMPEVYSKTEIDDKFTVANAQIDANADAIQKTREDYIQADSDIMTIVNAHAEQITTNKNDIDDLGNQVAEIEAKIPESASETNQLVTQTDLTNKKIEIMGEVNESVSELQTQITAQAIELATHRNDIDGLGDQVSAIEEKIPETASAENPLVTRSEISSVYKFKGSVATYNDLPTGATVGDVYNVTDTGANYAWDGSAWDKLSETVDLSSYATTAYVNAREQDIRDDYIQADSELQQQINAHATAITNLEDGVDSINGKIPTNASTTNLLVSTSQLNTETQDIRADFMADDAALQTQINGQATTIAGIQDDITGINSKISASASSTNKLVSASELSATEQDIRADMNEMDSQLQTQITAQAGSITTLRNDTDNLGDQVAGIAGKIPTAASSSNQLALNSQITSLQTQITANTNNFTNYRTSAAQDTIDADLQSQITAEQSARQSADTTLQNNITNGLALKLDKDQGSANQGKILSVGSDGQITLTAAPGGGLQVVAHNSTLTGAGTDASPLGIASSVLSELADKADQTVVDALASTVSSIQTDYTPKATTTALSNTVSGIQSDYVSKTATAAQTIVSSLQMPELTVGTAEGTLNLSITACVATIATNNGLDIISPTKFDTLPTTDDTTTWANALDTNLVRKAQVATAITDAVSNIDALPDQTGNAGKVLTTDGTTASWEDVPPSVTITLKEYDE